MPDAVNDNDRLLRVKRARYRATHRGTKEADLVVGGFFEKHHASWDDAALSWFEVILEEQDVDIMAWAFRTQPPPPALDGPLMAALMALDYVEVTR
jgi:antitoxin CptB